MMSASAAATASTPRDRSRRHRPREGIGAAGRCHRARRHRRAVLDRCLRAGDPNLGPASGRLRWRDVGPVRLHPTPARSTAGWASRRAGARPWSARRRRPRNPARPCPSHPPTRPLPGVDGSVPVPGWADWSAAARATNFDSSLGAVGAAAAAGKQCIVARRPGRRVAAAEPDGTVDNLGALRPREPGARSQRLPDQHRRRRALRDDVAAGEQAPDQSRAAQVSAIDERIGLVATAAPMARTSSSAVWRTPACRRDFAWLSPAAPLRPRRVAVDLDPPGRTDRAQDLTVTLLSARGLTVPDSLGAPR